MGAAKASPHSLVQELLNRSPERLWGFVLNGLRMRLLRDNASLTCQAYLEFDLEAMMNGEVYATLSCCGWFVINRGIKSRTAIRELLVGSLVKGGTGARDTGIGWVSRRRRESNRRVGKRFYRAPSQRIVAKRFEFGDGIHSGFVSSVVAAGLSSDLLVRCRRPPVAI